MRRTNRPIHLGVWVFGLYALMCLAGQDAEGSEGNQSYFGYVATYEAGPMEEGRIHVLQVHPSGPAEIAGLIAGDRIRKINGKGFQFANDLEMIRSFRQSTHPGERLSLSVERHGDLLDLSLIVGTLPDIERMNLDRWMEAARIWFEEGGIENCRVHQSRMKIYQNLESLSSAQGIVIAMERPPGKGEGVVYLTSDGLKLPLDRLQSTFLDALAAQLPRRGSWKLLVRHRDIEFAETGLVAILQTGPRTGQMGYISAPGPVNQ